MTLPVGSAVAVVPKPDALLAFEPATNAAVQRLTKQADAMLIAANKIEVVDEGSYIVAAELRRSVRGIERDAEDTERLSVAPFNAVVKWIRNMLDAPRATLKQSVVTLDWKMLEWKRAEDARVAKENARQRAEYDAAHPPIAPGVVDLNAPPPPPPVESSVPKVVGVKTVTRWTFRIIDANLIPRNYLIPDEKALQAIATAQHERASVPGVEFFAEQGVASGRR